MADSCLLYYITDRTAFGPDEPTRRRRLLERISEAIRAGVEYIQIRERDLSTLELEALAREAAGILKRLRTENRELKTALLINSRTDIALASRADGVHLRSDDVSPPEVCSIWRKVHVGRAAIGSTPQSTAGTAASAIEDSQRSPLIGVSCHTPGEVAQAATDNATFAVFAPVFEKRDAQNIQPAGLAQLREACRAKIPVLALGGVTLENAKTCFDAGAAGIAAIRLFQENDVGRIVERLRQRSN